MRNINEGGTTLRRPFEDVAFVFLAFTILCPCSQNRVNTFVNNISKENIMINITFPDGAVREFESGVTTFEIAQSISNSLAKKALLVNSTAN